MKTMTQIDLCRAYLAANTSDFEVKTKGRSALDGPVVTISRQAGARANSIATALVAELAKSRIIPRERSWTVFNQNLLEHVIQEHHLPEQTAAYFPEDVSREVSTVIAEILGLHPGTYTSHRKMAETIRSLAVTGNAVIVGRGANFLTVGIRRALNVRLVGSRERRIGHFSCQHGVAEDKAAHEVDHLDGARRRYVKSNFGHEIDDPQFYDLVVNTDDYDDASMCRLLRMALEEKCG